jgi:dihydropteroate synthase
MPTVVLNDSWATARKPATTESLEAMGENERILFVTGRLAESPLRGVLATAAAGGDFSYDVAVLGVSVAALLHTKLVARRLEPPRGFDRLVLPGWCQGDLDSLGQELGLSVERGPKDLFDLPEFLGRGVRSPVTLEEYTIEILAEINHAPRLDDEGLLLEAERLREAGADVIDLGMVPGESWGGVGAATRRLVEAGFRVSIDSFDRLEVESSVAAGAELVLSCSQANLDWAASLAAESGIGLVAIPTDPVKLETLEPVIERLEAAGVNYRVDPILEPIGFGFAASLERFAQARRRWPSAEMMMGTGNLTELSAVDSAGVNFLLAAVCEELGIRSVLTTEVVNWCRSSVPELDLARRLVHHSVENGVLPKHVDSRLLMLRDAASRGEASGDLARLAGELTDSSFRVFVEHRDGGVGCLHVMNRDGHWQHADPFQLFDTVIAETQAVLTAEHAFYLGYELSKARTALTLGKRYVQDEALSWGFLTRPETSAIHRRLQAGIDSQRSAREDGT